MNLTTIAVDLAKDVFEVAVADRRYQIVERHRLTRSQFERFIGQRERSLWVMEACGGAHHWARTLSGLGHEAKLLPPAYVRPYVRGNKTDRGDCAAILEAARNPEIRPVPVKSTEQQALMALHRVRSGWMVTRTARINLMRGLLREQGIAIPAGARVALKRVAELVHDQGTLLPEQLRALLPGLLEEVRTIEARTVELERTLSQQARADASVRRAMEIPGIGLLTATAARAQVGRVDTFKSARHFAAWVGLTPKEHSSGNSRHLGRMSKRGNVYLRTLLVHGARAVLAAVKRKRRPPKSLSRLAQWALRVEARCGHNKACVALANKLARTLWAVWRYERAYDPEKGPALAPSL